MWQFGLYNLSDGWGKAFKFKPRYSSQRRDSGRRPEPSRAANFRENGHKNSYHIFPKSAIFSGAWPLMISPSLTISTLSRFAVEHKSMLSHYKVFWYSQKVQYFPALDLSWFPPPLLKANYHVLQLNTSLLFLIIKFLGVPKKCNIFRRFASHDFPLPYYKHIITFCSWTLVYSFSL